MYEYCEPVSEPCEKCGHASSNNMGLWADASASVDDMTTALCLNCAFKSLGELKGLPALEEALYEGEILNEHADADGAVVTVKTAFGIVQIEHDASIEHKEWSDPGGGVNGAGAPRRSKSWTELDASGTGRVHVIQPRDEQTNVTTSYWASYFDDYDL
jgi:hypothetical protein